MTAFPHIQHIQCPLNKYTFKVKAIRNWTEKNCEGKILNLFCGPTKLSPHLDEIRNDVDLSVDAHYHLDALEFVKTWEGEAKFDTILLDPPYSNRKSMEMYNGNMASPFRQLKDVLPRILCHGGVVITFGYHSVVMGKARGFTVEKIGLFSHGGAIHDTIGTVERYIIYKN